MKKILKMLPPEQLAGACSVRRVTSDIERYLPSNRCLEVNVKEGQSGAIVYTDEISGNSVLIYPFMVESILTDVGEVQETVKALPILEWELIDDSLYRAKVINGWLVKSVTESLSITFIPDTIHEW